MNNQNWNKNIAHESSWKIYYTKPPKVFFLKNKHLFAATLAVNTEVQSEMYVLLARFPYTGSIVFWTQNRHPIVYPYGWAMGKQTKAWAYLCRIYRIIGYMSMGPP